MSTATYPVAVLSSETVNSTPFPWFALRVRSRFEKVTAAALYGKGYQQFLPLYRPQGRRTEIELPLFPGYVFCRFNPQHRLPILTSPGIVHIVGIGRDPVPVDETEMAAIRKVVESGIAAEPWAAFEIGQRVRIRTGVLEGIEGTLVRFKGNHRFIVSVTLLQRSVALEIGPELMA